MLQIFKELDLAVPADITVSISSRVFTVKGPRGTLTKVSIPLRTQLDDRLWSSSNRISTALGRGQRRFLVMTRDAWDYSHRDRIS